MTRARALGLLLICACVFVLGSSVAVAQEQPKPAETKPDAKTETKTKKRADKDRFYDFDDLLIGGELRAPNAYFASARQRMRWGRLLRLKRSFVPTLMSTDKYPILRGK